MTGSIFRAGFKQAIIGADDRMTPYGVEEFRARLIACGVEETEIERQCEEKAAGAKSPEQASRLTAWIAGIVLRST